MSIYKTRPFARLAKKIGMTDEALAHAVQEMKLGTVHAALGGNVYKQRIPVPGRGKSGGSRAIIAANLQDRWIFLHCYLKKDTDTITSAEKTAFKDFAEVYLGLDAEIIKQALKNGILEEIYEKPEN